MAEERAIDPSEYESLKVAEHLGLLNQEDFDRLLEFDFQEYVKDVPPIEGKFSPEEELAKIKGLPREQKREALVVFKEKLARQREALAALRVFIERSIEFDHDVPKEKLMEWVRRFSARYGFNLYQRLVSEHLIDRYYENRTRALEIRKQFADDRELVRNLTGVYLGEDGDEELVVSAGPMSIDIATGGLNAGKLYERSDKPTVGLLQYGGFASRSAGEDPVYYVVINQDRWVRTRKYDDPTGEKTRKHEHEHHKNKLFRAIFGHGVEPVEVESYLHKAGYVAEQDPETRRLILEDFFSESMAFALERAKDEMTASLYDKDLAAMQKQLSRLFFSGGGPYDYLGYVRNSSEFKNDPLYQETAERMLVKEYRAIIQRAVDSYAELVEKGKYSTQEATALLTDVPLEKWPKTVRRFLEYKTQERDIDVLHSERDTLHKRRTLDSF